MSIVDHQALEDALETCFNREWEPGIENEALDISQFESYINDEQTDTSTYFSDLHGCGGASPDTSPCLQPQVQSAQPLHPQVHQPHHLPDSPPDSGSEPPFSPDNPAFSPAQISGLCDIYGTTGTALSRSVLDGHYGTLASSQHQPLQPHSSVSNGTHPMPSSLHGFQQQQLVFPGSRLPQPGILAAHVHTQNNPPGVYLSQPVAMATSAQGSPRVTGTVQEGSISHTGKKRRLTDINPALHECKKTTNIKQDPDQVACSKQVSPSSASHALNSYSPEEDEFTMDSASSGGFGENCFQCIKFQPFQQHNWHALCDASMKEINVTVYQVDADKGFNFSNPDESFVCQKKNHFQVTTHVEVETAPHFVKLPEGVKNIDKMCIHFFGVKTESPSNKIKIEQSQSDRSKKAFHPVLVDLKTEQVAKVTVGRLHFSETTSNNMRKKGKPNPDQRYFYLVVSLQAHCGEFAYPVAAQASEKIIVRASNPGQFESDVEYTFQRGSYPESIYHMGRVGINTDRPDEALCIHGNIRISGQILQPSDIRAKRNIQEIDTREQLKNVQNLRVVKYAYKDGFAKDLSLMGKEIYDTGVIAQEVKKIIPEAVKETGDVTLSNGEKIPNFLLVNKERIFMENVGAVKELCKVTGNLENRIGELERMNRTISQLRRGDSFKSYASSVSTKTSGTGHSKLSSFGGRRRYSRRSLKNTDEGYFSNKTLLLTTIILVAIMALCLIAIGTLFLMDYQGRRWSGELKGTCDNKTNLDLDYTSVSFLNITTSPEEVKDDSDALHSSMTSSPYSDDPRSRYSTDMRTLTSLVFTTKPTFGLVTDPPQSYAYSRPPVLGRPPSCPIPASGQAPQCDMHCCQSDHLVGVDVGVASPFVLAPTLNPVSPASTAITVTRRLRLNSGVPSVSPSYALYHESDVMTNKLSTNDPGLFLNDSSLHSDSQRYKSVPSKKWVYDGGRIMRYNLRRSPSSRNIKRTLSRRSVLSSRQTSKNDLFERIPVVYVEEFEAEISRLYCLNTSHQEYQACVNRNSANLTYAVPLSMFMSETNLTLRFQFSSSSYLSPPTQCMNCTSCFPNWQLPNKSCFDAEGDASPVTERIFRGEDPSNYYIALSNVGKLQQSFYKFRIPTIMTQDPCIWDVSDAGVKYYEVNFIFYRVCDA